MFKEQGQFQSWYINVFDYLMVFPIRRRPFVLIYLYYNFRDYFISLISLSIIRATCVQEIGY